MRWLLFFLGLVFVAFALAALAYSFWPLETVSQQAPLAPTLFVSP